MRRDIWDRPESAKVVSSAEGQLTAERPDFIDSFHQGQSWSWLILALFAQSAMKGLFAKGGVMGRGVGTPSAPAHFTERSVTPV